MFPIFNSPSRQLAAAHQVLTQVAERCDTPLAVRVRFSAEIAHTIKDRIWMPGQKISNDSDGRTTLEFEAAGKMELVSWILSYGIHAEVLDPPELRKEIKRQAKGMVAV